MSFQSEFILKALLKLNPSAKTFPEFAEAIRGHTQGDSPSALYEYKECVKILAENAEISEKEAEKALVRYEHMGPIFIHTPENIFPSFKRWQCVMVDSPRYKGPGIVTSDFPNWYQSQTRPGYVEVGLENGNSWMYPCSDVTIAKKTKAFRIIANAVKVAWQLVR